MGRIVLLAPLAGVLIAGAASAQQQQYDQELMKANYEAKIHKDFVAYGGWLTDFDEARALAAKEKKLLFVYFTRSYAK